MSANEKQVGGEHYKQGYQHWDMVADGYLDYFKGQATKYLARYRRKNGVQDLQKSFHYLEKLNELAARGRHISPPRAVTMAALFQFLNSWGAEYDHLDRAAMAAVVVADSSESLRTAMELVSSLQLKRKPADGSEPSAGYVAQ
jgi:Protein of unknwon function (DUF3310)